MKKGLTTLMCASALLGATSLAFAGAYGEAEQPEEMPAPAPAPAAAMVEPESDARIMREFAGFESDAETARGFWAELGTVYFSETDGFADVDGLNSFARLAYGQEMWEVGLKLPYLWADVDGGPSDDGLGNLSIWGKVLPLRTEMFTAGGGLIVSAPTGDDLFGSSISVDTISNQLSRDEWGFNPFLTGSVALGAANLRSSIGYSDFVNHHDDDALTYNVAALFPATDRVILRGEVIGSHYFESSVDLDPVSFMPGVDIVFPLDGMELLLRPTGGVGITDEAADWQLGLSVALAQTES